MQVLKEVCAIDVAKDELVCTLGRLSADLSQQLYARQSFPNNTKGFAALLTFVQKKATPGVSPFFAMEATGVYHEELAYFLCHYQQTLSIILPNKMAAYMRTLAVKTITDTTAADAICRFALERCLDAWQAPNELYRTLRSLTRERTAVVAERTAVKNQLHALRHSYQPMSSQVKRLEQRVAFLERQEAAILQEIEQLIKKEKELRAAVALLTTICGVGDLTAATVLGETNCFSLIESRRQLCSYAGFDVREKQSGTSVKGKASISKRGNKHLRACMHFAALAAVRNDERFKAIYVRLVSRHGIKMKALVGVQRRILELMYTIWKSGKPYDKEYLQKAERSSEDRSAQASHAAA